jgi:hypothetical protein
VHTFLDAFLNISLQFVCVCARARVCV